MPSACFSHKAWSLLAKDKSNYKGQSTLSQRQPCDFSGSKCGFASLDSSSRHHWNSFQLHKTCRDRFTKGLRPRGHCGGSGLLLGGAWISGGGTGWVIPAFLKLGFQEGVSGLPWGTPPFQAGDKQRLTSMLQTRVQLVPAITALTCQGLQAVSLGHRHPTNEHCLPSYS